MNIFVNHELLARVKKARLEMPEYMTPVPEDWQITQIANKCKNLTDTELCAVVIVAIKRNPRMVLQALIDEMEGKHENNREHT